VFQSTTETCWLPAEARCVRSGRCSSGTPLSRP